MYAASRHQVTDVWVAGRHLLKDRLPTTFDEGEVRQRTRAWGARIAAGARHGGVSPGNRK